MDAPIGGGAGRSGERPAIECTDEAGYKCSGSGMPLPSPVAPLLVWSFLLLRLIDGRDVFPAVTCPDG